MGTLHIVFGPQGAGKSTYARTLAQEVRGTRFSIDDWMHQLYGPDMPQPLDFAWIMERVQRCETRIWATAADVAQAGGNIVLDLGFMKAASRADFLSRAKAQGLPAQLHFVDAPLATRKERVLARNVTKGETFAFEVTAGMFDFMEQQFERPGDAELAMATTHNT